ncbi:MAG: hypothetical protein PVJ02_17345 [Gemmatimonadota bacterium]|jgi:hypothetical protein
MRRFTALLVAVGVLVPSSAQAQSLRYTSTTRAELSGAVGRVVSSMGGLGEPTVETTSIQGSKIRKDDEKTSEIMDWDAGTMTLLDHASRTFVRYSFADMAQAMAEGVKGAEGAQGQQQAPAGEAAPQGGEEPRAELEWKVSTDRTGKHETIAGYDTEEVILTVELHAKQTAEAAAASGEDEPQQADMAVVTDLWLSTDFPEQKLMEQMQGEALKQFRESGAAQEMASSMQGVSAYNPGVEDAWQKNREALEELDGTALRATMHFVLLPPGVSLDRDQVLADADRSLSSDVADAAAESAKDAAKNAVSGLAGRFGFGKKKKEPKEETAPEPTQAEFMRIISEVHDVSTDPLDPSVFKVPEGYTERKVEAPVGG